MMHDKIQDKWERRATVRSRPRIILDSSENGYFYPLANQPIAIHPEIFAKGDDTLHYLLVQSFYKYCNDISIIETRVVNNVVMQVITDALSTNFTKEQKLNLYTIMVDEAYHGYVAYDAMIQIENYTQISPLPLPKTIEIERAMVKVKQQLAPEYHGIFDFICVCLAENTLTKEILTMTDKEETHPFFQKIIKDHFADESRHSGIFFNLLKDIWQTLSDDYKENIAAVLPRFLELYLGLEVQTEFDKQVLVNLGFSNQEADSIVEDTYSGFRLTKENPKLKNILLQLDKSGVADKFVLPKLQEMNWGITN